MFIVILDHDNMGVDAIFVTLVFMTKKVIKEIRIFDNGRPNLHIWKLNIQLITL